MLIQIDFPDEKIRGLLCCAFEGGSNYWYMIDKIIYPAGFRQADYREGGKAQPSAGYWNWSQIVPLQKGGALVIETKAKDEIAGKKKWVLDREAIARGLKVMREKYPKHFGDAMADDGDADTGDVFLQCCLFGELVFG